MQLPAQSDGVNCAAAPVEGHDSGASPQQQQQQGGGLRRPSPAAGKAPSSSATSTSPSSPGSPSRSGGASRDKPVKLLPCPRCESMNTKFCYYNNYSVTQPRHFCRQCQRYWTAGGTLRNVPVGGGSRKKNRHPRGEPYLQQRGLGVVSPPGSHPPGPFGISSAGGQSVLQNAGGGHFQQMLSQDMGFAQLNFSQLPGFPANGYHHHHQHHHPYGTTTTTTTMDHPVDLSQQVMYGTAPQMHPVAPYFFPQHQETQPTAPPSFPNDTTGTVKTEFWSHPGMAPPPPQALPSNPNPSKPFESSMLLNLGLNNNSRAPQQQEPGTQAKPAWDQAQSQQHQADMKPTVAAPTTKNGSPPHGSSTIEEEGSTPTNSYSNSGYEEGDAVSSMWHNLHDMDNIFQ